MSVTPEETGIRPFTFDFPDAELEARIRPSVWQPSCSTLARS